MDCRKVSRPPIRSLLARSVWALALLLATIPALARVYWRTAGGPLGGGPDPAWSLAYEADWRINEGDAHVQAWSARLEVNEAAVQMKARAQSLGGACYASESADLAWGIACGGGRVVRYLVASLDALHCMVFVTDQSFADFQASLRPPDRSQIRAAEPFPGSQPESYYASKKTTLALETSSAAGSAAEVSAHFAETLGRDGWAMPLPARRAAGEGGTALYLKGSELLVVRTVSAGEGGGCRTMVFHKRVGAARDGVPGP